VSAWPQISTKLRHDKIRTPFFQSIEELGRFLNQFDTDALPTVYTLFQAIIDPLLQMPHTPFVLSQTITVSTWQTLLALMPIRTESAAAPSNPIAAIIPNQNTQGFFRGTQQRHTYFSDPAREMPRNDRR
jgi:hypothetical protein